jgi:hypothetical protein
MSLQLDRAALEAMTTAHVRQIAAQAKPVLERRLIGGVTLGLEAGPSGVSLVASDPQAMVQEYGTGEQPGQPWAMQGLADYAGGHRGDHP